MDSQPQTWHHGLVADWWAAFNDDFRAHEIPYFREYLEDDGQPALDVACGTGRLLLPYLRAGLDVDGCDVSADMVAACRRKAANEGLDPKLSVQPMHELDIPRTYRTIFVCGSFGVGSDRTRDAEALIRFREHLEPGGTLLIDAGFGFADPAEWSAWAQEQRASLPQTRQPESDRRRTADGTELAISTRLIDVDPVEPQMTKAIRVERWRDGVLEAEEEHLLHHVVYFEDELRQMLERAGFRDIVVHGEHERRPPTSDDVFLVFAAKT
ncbi:MAG: methyltransferase [Acidimicrobiales bacterium]|nr:MAG: methyltransferase [Acidimicrobiales bacterium]